MKRESKAFKSNMDFMDKRRREIFDSLIDVYNYPHTLIGNVESKNYIEFVSGNDDFEINDSRINVDDIEEVSIIKKGDKKFINIIVVSYNERNEYDIEILDNQYDEAVNLSLFLNRIIQKVEESLLLCNKEYKSWIKHNGICSIDYESDDEYIYNLFKEGSPYKDYEDEDIIYFSKLRKENNKIYWNFRNKVEIELPAEDANELLLIDLDKIKCAKVNIYAFHRDRSDKNVVSFDFVFTYPIERG